jgi:hypothetical protein
MRQRFRAIAIAIAITKFDRRRAPVAIDAQDLLAAECAKLVGSGKARDGSARPNPAQDSARLGANRCRAGS